MAHFRLRRRKTAGNHIGAVGAASRQPASQLLHGWRQNEHANCLRKKRSHLLRALPVDFEQNIAANSQLIGNPLLRSTVEIAMHLRPLEKVLTSEQVREFGGVDEMVFATVLLNRPRN